MRVLARISWILIALASSSAAQTQSASVTFTLDFQGANPSHYEITVREDGTGSYGSNGQLNSDSEPADLAPLPFTPSDKARVRIFDLAQKAHYFAGKIDSGRKNIANTGTKTLAYKDASRNCQATYNYSQMPSIQELTAIFQSLSTALEYGRRLAYFRKYQKLALDQDLKQMEQMQRENSLGDIQAIAPVLNEIANDSTLINLSRARALRLLNGQSH